MGIPQVPNQSVPTIEILDPKVGRLIINECDWPEHEARGATRVEGRGKQPAISLAVESTTKESVVDTTTESSDQTSGDEQSGDGPVVPSDDVLASMTKNELCALALQFGIEEKDSKAMKRADLIATLATYRVT